MISENNIKKFFEEEVSLSLNSVSFNFGKSSFFQDTLVNSNVPDNILSVYSLNVDKDKIAETNMKIDQHQEMIHSKLRALKIVNPVLIVNGV